jgi:hypothetical protein
LCDLLGGKLLKPFSEERTFSAVRQNVAKTFQKRCFSATVGTEYAEDMPLVQREGYIGKNIFLP